MFSTQQLGSRAPLLTSDSVPRHHARHDFRMVQPYVLGSLLRVCRPGSNAGEPSRDYTAVDRLRYV